MEFDAVVSVQDRRVLVCESAPLERLTAELGAEGEQVVLSPRSALATEPLEQRDVRGDEVVVAERRRLVRTGDRDAASLRCAVLGRAPFVAGHDPVPEVLRFVLLWSTQSLPSGALQAATTIASVFESGSEAEAGHAATSIAPMARTIAAALTPLRADGAELDDDALQPYLTFLKDGGVDGILLLGTTGEGILLSLAERKRAISNAVTGPLPVLAHCGAQSTADTAALAAHAAEAGAEAIAVIAPPYFPLDDDALLAHFVAAARACAPLPFYVYELEKASGYAIPVTVVERLRDLVDNVAGMKVSDAPFAKVAPYMLEGLDVFIGAEALIGEGLAAGAAGAVSGLASAFPEIVVEAVRSGDSTAAGELRAVVERFPRHAALKAVVASKGVPLREDVRAPLRQLTDAERTELLASV